MNAIRFDQLSRTHDLSLPDFGPYARDLMTLSHIADSGRGLRMDFFLVPGIHRRSFFPPMTLRECGYYPAEASADFSYYSMHQELEGRDGFFCETAYFKISGHFRAGRIVFCNHTAVTQAASLMYFARFSPEKRILARMPQGGIWMDALDYTALHFAEKRFDTHLIPDGGRRGEEQNVSDAVGGRCIGCPRYNHQLPCFGENAGDEISFLLHGLPRKGRVFARIRLDAGRRLELEVRHPHGICRTTLAGCGRFHAAELRHGELAEGTWSLRSLGGKGGFRLDGIFILPEDVPPSEDLFPDIRSLLHPGSARGPVPESAWIFVDGLDKRYLTAWSSPHFTEREYHAEHLTDLLIQDYRIRQPYYNTANLFPSGKGEYCREVYELPIVVPPGGECIRYFLCGASDNPVELEEEFRTLDRSPEALEAACRAARENAFPLRCTPEGEPYRSGQRLMSAALMTNIGFPIHCGRENLRCHLPDKYYWSLYSWDSGFSGLGLLELDRTRAIENLNVYLTGEDADSAFVFHGTPLPVQAYLLAEIWNREPDLELLEYFYPRLRRCYLFLSGHTADSTFLRPSGLLGGWDYFYNSGGWDDYPPQWRIREEKRNDILPVAPTAHVIRCARFLIHTARELGRDADIPGYEADIAAFAHALRTQAWDASAGVFSYTVCDETGHFREIYRDPESGVNYNLGMDGASVLLAGSVCDREQRSRLLELLMTPGRCWSEYGLSTVDMSAPYFRPDGYWNGSIWMPHQWFFWKAMLDLGEAEFASRIAMCALELWKRETDLSCGCFEHFSLSHGRGCGCPHFGALSAPVLCWFAAYFSPGRLTGGFDFWVHRRRKIKGAMEVNCTLGGRKGDFMTLLYVPENEKCTVSYNGNAVPVRKHRRSWLEFELPCATEGTLEITG